MRAAASAALLLLAGCVQPVVGGTVAVFSDPAGAEVLVDGRPTGLHTPCDVTRGLLAGGGELEIRKKGYKTQRRQVVRRHALEMSRPAEAATVDAPELFPLWWTAGDFLLPFRLDSGLYPEKIFVRLAPLPGEGR